MSQLNVSRIAVAFLLVGNVLVSAPRAIGGDNYAFLVAVGDYDVKQLKPLAYTRNDVLEFAKVLTDSGFKSENIVLMHDDLKTLKSQRYLPQAEKIRKEFDLLLSGVDEGDSVIVAFAGHGVQFEGDDRNFFCPVDADLEEPKWQSLISLKEIYTMLKDCKADRKLLLVDACRNDPLSKLARSREKVKLNSVTRPQVEPVPKGIVALFSCSAGQESYEWPDLEHGVFFQQILTGWKGAADTGDQELSLDELVAYTRKNTQTFARLKLGAIQTPQLKGEFNGTWVLWRFEGFAGTRAGQQRDDNGLKMKFCGCPPGTFTMGSPKTEKVREDNEDQVQVTLTKGFWLGKFEVTQGQWQQIMGTTLAQQAAKPGSNGNGENADAEYPMYLVNHDEAVEFCNKLTEQERQSGRLPNDWEYRLPTEAQWEYACRAGTTTTTASEKLPVAKFDKNSGTGSYKPNDWGLCEMHGSVWEWCADWYQKKLPGGRDPAILQAGRHPGPPFLGVVSTNMDLSALQALQKGGFYRVYRGGNYGFFGKDPRSALCSWTTPSSRLWSVGFRVAIVQLR